MAQTADEPAIPPQSSFVARVPTGAKIFLILSAALLPLAVIAFFATLKTTQGADEGRRAQLRIATAESARKLSIELVGDMTALRVALNALDQDKSDAPSCARAQGVFAQQSLGGTRFVIMDRQRRALCGSDFPADLASHIPKVGSSIATQVIPEQGVILAIAGARRTTTAAAFFPVAFLTETSKPTDLTLPYEARIEQGDDAVFLTRLPPAGTFERRETMRAPLGTDGLILQTSVHSAPITSPLIIALLLPILMWAAAASISWFVVDRLLIRPLRRLRTSVAAYVPGEEIDPKEVRLMPTQEIRELGDTFRTISRTVAAHEAGLAEGLVRQTRLTREVHHRVKNNLQVISSLINFHARGARSAEATAAYASIQRRVDALAVVHRHHFAEMEDNRGLSLRAVISELASNIRATAPESATRLSIVSDVDPVLVTQDVAIAVAFLITEIVELAMTFNQMAQIRISAKPDDTEDRTILRVNSPALIDSDALRAVVEERYGRVMEGLSRQLRSRLHHDPLVGAYEIAIAITGCE